MARVLAMSAVCAYATSITVPPVNSIDGFRPRVTRKNTAARKVMKEIAFSTSAWRMNGMSLLMRKNSTV